MPALQRGVVDKPKGRVSWRARWYDEHGKRRQKLGFTTKTLAHRWLDKEVKRIDRIRNGDMLGAERTLTVQQLVDEFMAVHSAEANTIATLEYRLKHVTGRFADVRIDRLAVPELALWRKQLPAGSAWHIHKAFRQVLNYAVAAGYLQRNAAREIPNPEPKRMEVPVFESPADVDAVAGELDPAYRAIPVFASETGLRPEEWIALERRDLEIDKENLCGVVHVRRVFTAGELKPYGKQPGSLRTVALTRRTVQAIQAMPIRIDTPLLFPGERLGRHLNLNKWRRSKWSPAVELAGQHIDEHGRKLKLTPYSLRHTYAAWSIAAGIDTYTIAKRMGTSVEQIEKTYGHLLRGSLDAERGALEAWQARIAEAEKQAREKT